jgi:hypothetical protein
LLNALALAAFIVANASAVLRARSTRPARPGAR